MRQNFLRRKKIQNEPDHRDPPSRIRQRVLPRASPMTVQFSSASSKRFSTMTRFRHFRSGRRSSQQLRLLDAEAPSFSESLPRFLCYWALRSLFTSILMSNFLVLFPRLRCNFRFIAALVGHSGLSCGPPPYWHCLSAYSQAQLDQVTLRLNQRRRKTLGFQTLRVNSRQVLRRPSEPSLEIV